MNNRISKEEWEAYMKMQTNGPYHEFHLPGRPWLTEMFASLVSKGLAEVHGTEFVALAPFGKGES